MASAYGCAKCGMDLNLSSAYLYPAETYFEAGNKGTLSFSWADESKLQIIKEDKIRPFFETIDYWGIQRKRTKLRCAACAAAVGYIYDDGPPLMQGHGQLGFGPSQAVPRAPRIVRMPDRMGFSLSWMCLHMNGYQMDYNSDRF